jgi:hypothetical protein
MPAAREEPVIVDQGDESDGIARNYENHLATAVQDAVKTLSLRTIGGSQVGQVQIAEIKGLVSL